MELTHLRYFLEVARTQHMTQSAKKLCIAQPALSQSIHKLEAELDVPLFVNKGRNIQLTEFGKYFYEHLKPLVEDIDALPKQLAAMAKKENATINLNVLAASSLITKAIILYKASDKATHFNLIQNEETRLFDICVHTYADYVAPPFSDDDVFVCSEKIFLAVPNEERYKKQKRISLKDVENENFIELCGSKQFRNICNHYCFKMGFHSKIAFESDNVNAVKDAVAAGIGVGFWPEISWGRIGNGKIRLLEIADANFKRDIVVSCRRNKQDNGHVERFFQFLVRHLKNSGFSTEKGNSEV